jgi:hypothetical protein
MAFGDLAGPLDNERFGRVKRGIIGAPSGDRGKTDRHDFSGVA